MYMFCSSCCYLTSQMYECFSNIKEKKYFFIENSVFIFLFFNVFFLCFFYLFLMCFFADFRAFYLLYAFYLVF